MAGGNAGFWSFVVVQLAVAALLLGVILYAPGPWDLQRSIGTVLAITSMALLALSRYQLGKSFSVRPQAKARHGNNRERGGYAENSAHVAVRMTSRKTRRQDCAQS